MNRKLFAVSGGSKSYIILQALCKWAALLAQILVVYSIATVSEIALEGYGVDKLVLAKRAVYIILAILIAFVMDRASAILETKASDKVKKKLLLRIAKRIQEFANDSEAAENEYTKTEKPGKDKILTDILPKLQKIDSYLGGYYPQIIYIVMASITVAGVLFTTNLIPALFVLLAIIFLPIVIQMKYIGVGKMISDILSYVGFVGATAIALELYANDKITVTGGVMIALLSWEVFAALRPLARMAVETIDCNESMKKIYLFLGELTPEELEGDEEDDEKDSNVETIDSDKVSDKESDKEEDSDIELTEAVSDKTESDDSSNEDPFEIIAGGDKTEVLAKTVEEAEPEKDEITVSDLENMLAEARDELGIKSNKDKNAEEAEERDEEFANGIDITNNKQSGAKQIGEFIKTILTPAVILMSFAGVLEIMAGVLGISDLIGENYQPWFYTILIALVVVSAALSEIASHVKKVNSEGIVRTQTAVVIALFMTVFIGRYSMLTAMISLLGCYLVAGLIPYLDVRRKKLPLKRAAESQSELETSLNNLNSGESVEEQSEKDESFVEDEKPANGLEIEEGEQIEKDENAIRLNTVSYKYDHLRRDLEDVQRKEADRRSFAGMASTLTMLIILLISVWQVGYGALRPMEYMLVVFGAYFVGKIIKSE